MITPRIVINISASERLLARVRARAADLRPVFEGPITNRVHAMFGKIFDSEGAYIGNKWKPLSLYTLREKAKIGRAHMGILRRYNALWSSLVKRSSPLGHRVVTPASLLIGTNVPYAVYHQLGTPRLPQRKIIPSAAEIPQADIDEWESLVVAHLES